SENAAHRIAVEWNINGTSREGVYIPRRDSSSRINAIADGRIFPGMHHRANFAVQETDDKIHLHMQSNGATILIDAKMSSVFPDTSIFRSLARASDFFEAGSLGYSPAARPAEFDG